MKVDGQDDESDRVENADAKSANNFSLFSQFVGDEDEMFPISRERALFSRATRAKADCKKFFTVGGLSHLEDPTENLDFRRNIVDYFNEII